MLFDLRGRRRRVVQVVYLALALLLGGGLVLFGIGGEVSGGLLNAFEGGGGQSGDSVLQQSIDRREERLRANPRDERALQALVRDHYALANQDDSQPGFSDDEREALREAAAYWQRYLDAFDEPSAGTAQYALQIYAPEALDQPKERARAAQIVAADRNDYAAYLFLVEAAAAAGDKRTAKLAAQRAVDLAPKGQKKQVEQQAEALQKPAQQQPSG
jgi:hypothetical protein